MLPNRTGPRENAPRGAQIVSQTISKPSSPECAEEGLARREGFLRQERYWYPTSHLRKEVERRLLSSSASSATDDRIVSSSLRADRLASMAGRISLRSLRSRSCCSGSLGFLGHRRANRLASLAGRLSLCSGSRCSCRRLRLGLRSRAGSPSWASVPTDSSSAPPASRDAPSSSSSS